MKTWDLRTVEAEAHEPQILSSGDEGRVIVLQLPAGEELQDHEVHERAWVAVVVGEVEVTTAEQTVVAGPGHLFEFAPGERRRIAAGVDSRLLILLTPWPGDGHPGAMTLEEKAAVRERAAEHAQG